MTSYAVDGIVTTPLFGSKNPPHWRKTTFLVNIHLPANLLDLAPDSSLVVNLSYDTKESAGGKDQVGRSALFFFLQLSGEVEVAVLRDLRAFPHWEEATHQEVSSSNRGALSYKPADCDPPV